MSKKHDAVFDDVLSGLSEPVAHSPRERGTRFLKRRNTLSDKLSGEVVEKSLRWVDPDTCRMWHRHNRDYALLNEDNCADLIEGLKAQGQQEFAAIVRRIDGPQQYEVVCGARRHWAVSWLRANNYPQFKYLIDVRDLTDEEAFRLADVENRDRSDLSDYERAVDYAEAIKLYYGGKQKAMAERLEVSEAWLSRYLNLAKLPAEIVAAFADKTQIKELHARTIKPLLAAPKSRKAVLVKAAELAREQKAARAGQGAPIEATQVLNRLRGATKGKRAKAGAIKTYVRKGETEGVAFRKSGTKIQLEFKDSISRQSLSEAINAFMNENFPAK